MIIAREYMGDAESTTISSPAQTFQLGKKRWLLVVVNQSGSLLLPRGADLMLGHTYTVTAQISGSFELKFDAGGNNLLVIDKAGVPRTGMFGTVSQFGLYPVVHARLVVRTANSGAGDWTVFSVGDPD